MRSDSYKCSEIESLALRILNLPQAPLSLAKILPFIDTFLHSVQPIHQFLSVVTKMILKLPLDGKKLWIWTSQQCEMAVINGHRSDDLALRAVGSVHTNNQPRLNGKILAINIQRVYIHLQQ